MEICVLASGKLGLESLIYLYGQYHVTAVFTDRSSDAIIDFACQHNIKLFIGNPRLKKPELWQTVSCDILLSVNYLFIIDQFLISIARLYAINIHGSLLPKYRGRTPHVWAIINGEKKTGITAHKIEAEVDTGDIILQKEIIIENEDTGAMILDKFRKQYPILLKELLNRIITRTIEFKPQDNSIATYFGKRTPESGLINFSWFRERIENWIRAQADPYPGAFFFYEGNKVFVHKAALCDLGMNSEMQDGTILEIRPRNEAIIVKTPNGCIELLDIRAEQPIFFTKGKILNS